MKKAVRISIKSLVITGVILMFIISCAKDRSQESLVDYTGQQGTVTDVDGNIYPTIGIGTQIWMAANLKVTHYRNGDTIPNITDSVLWSNYTTGAYCNYNNDLSNSIAYGSLYNWYAVTDIRTLAPVGWHVPSDAEWRTLVNFLGGDDIAGGKMKETGTNHWTSPNAGATNESGFTSLPSGDRGSYYATWFTFLGRCGSYWSSSQLNSSIAFGRYLLYDYAFCAQCGAEKQVGFAVRLVKD